MKSCFLLFAFAGGLQLGKPGGSTGVAGVLDTAAAVAAVAAAADIVFAALARRIAADAPAVHRIAEGSLAVHRIAADRIAADRIAEDSLGVHRIAEDSLAVHRIAETLLLGEDNWMEMFPKIQDFGPWVFVVWTHSWMQSFGLNGIVCLLLFFDAQHSWFLHYFYYYH